MANYNSANTGEEIDDAVSTVKGVGTGLLVKTSTGAGVKRTIVGTSDEIVVSNGDGVSGNPTLSLASSVTASLALADSSVQPSDIAEFVPSDPTGVTGADAITNMMSLTQAEYDAITPGASTLYLISG